MVMSTTTNPLLRSGSQGDEVRRLQTLLCAQGYQVAVDGTFGPATRTAVGAFQSQHLDQHGQPLVVDGQVGPLTWWALTHPKPEPATNPLIDFLHMPPGEAGGSARGRAALQAAIGELVAGAGEEGGNNRGPAVKKYLNGLAPEGANWCAAFVSWCFSQSGPMPYRYSIGARDILAQFKTKGWAFGPDSKSSPEPGDIVVWWRDKLSSWEGHIGFVYELRDGMLYTIEGNHSTRVAGFSYVYSRMTRLLGFGRVSGLAGTVAKAAGRDALEGASRVEKATALYQAQDSYPQGCSEFICKILGIDWQDADSLMGDSPTPIGVDVKYPDLSPGDIVGWKKTDDHGAHVAIYISATTVFYDVREPGATPRALSSYGAQALYRSSNY